MRQLGHIGAGLHTVPRFPALHTVEAPVFVDVALQTVAPVNDSAIRTIGYESNPCACTDLLGRPLGLRACTDLLGRPLGRVAWLAPQRQCKQRTHAYICVPGTGGHAVPERPRTGMGLPAGD